MTNSTFTRTATAIVATLVMSATLMIGAVGPATSAPAVAATRTIA